LPGWYKEVNCTEPSPSVRVPWFYRIDLLIKAAKFVKN
jgi:hypothetical protein